MWKKRLLLLCGFLLCVAGAVVCPETQAKAEPSASGKEAGASWRVGEMIVRFKEAMDPRIPSGRVRGEIPFSRLPLTLQEVHRRSAIELIHPLFQGARAAGSRRV